MSGDWQSNVLEGSAAQASLRTFDDGFDEQNGAASPRQRIFSWSEVRLTVIAAAALALAFTCLPWIVIHVPAPHATFAAPGIVEASSSPSCTVGSNKGTNDKAGCSEPE